MRFSLTVHEDEAVEIAGFRRLRLAAIRTTALRVLLAAALIATMTGIVLLARGAGSGRAAVLPESATTGCIALDVSGSISGPIYERVSTTLKGIAEANQSVCLVMFSNTAYELLPPNSPPTALLQFVRFFKPISFINGFPQFRESPWAQFSGGTHISKGIITAEQALHRAGVKHGSILLVSDLDDWPSDEPALESEALHLRTVHIPVRIVPLFARQSNKNYFAGLFGADAFVNPKAFTHRATEHVQPIASSVPWGLLAVGGALVLLLFGNERWNTRLAVEVPE
jgi:hypothetical protein